MDEILIRQCVASDLTAVLALDDRWHEENIAWGFQFYTLDSLAASMEQSPRYFLVAESAGVLVGYVSGSARLSDDLPALADDTPYLEIENLYVLPEYRSRNLGGRLLDRLIEIGEEHGLMRQIVSTDSRDMDRVMAFYRSHSFTPYFVRFFR